jgi:hypothetical protein
VQDVIDLRTNDLQLAQPYQLRLFGIGCKERYCPLWPQTAQAPMAMCDERSIDLRSDTTVFLNHRGTRLTRFGVRYIPAKHIDRVRASRHEPRAEATAPPQHAPQRIPEHQRPRGCAGATAYGVAKSHTTVHPSLGARTGGFQYPSELRVSPGIIRTRFQVYLTSEQVEDNTRNRLPLRREGRPGDVAAALAALAKMISSRAPKSRWTA